MARLQATQITGSLLTTTSVGIGTTSPIYKLDVNGNIASIDQIVLRTASTNAAGMEIGLGRTGNGYAYLDLIGDATYSDYGLRIIRYDSGANTPSAIIHRGTGDFSLQTLEASPIILITNSGEKMRVLSNGYVGIGTSNPGTILQISPGSSYAANPTLQVVSSYADGYDATLSLNNTYTGGRNWSILSTNNSRGTIGGGKLVFQDRTAGTDTALMTLVTGGSVGIGTTGPLTLLDVRSGAITAGTQTSVQGSTIISGYYSSGNLTVFGSEFSSGGPFLGYAVSPSTSAAASFFSSTTIAIPRSAYIQDGASHRWYIGASQTVAIGSAASLSEVMRINSDGNLGIGTTNPTTRLEIAQTNVVTDTIGNLFIRTTNNQAVNIGGQLSLGGYYSASNIYTFASIAGRKENSTSGNVAGYLSLSTCTSGGTNTERMRIDSTGNVGIGTTNPLTLLDVNGSTRLGTSLSSTHTMTGSLNVGGGTFNNAISIDRMDYFQLQPYIEGANIPLNVLQKSGTAPTFTTMTGSVCPFGKVAYNVSYYEAAGDYIPVNPGETLYGEIWAYRSSGATGTAGVLYCGIARYDKNKNQIDANAGLTYFIASNVTVPSTSTWTKYSGTTTLPLTHTPYGSSDGGPVRYIRAYIIVNYTNGTIPTYWGAFKIRKTQITRDTGALSVSGSLGIGTNSPDVALTIYKSSNPGIRVYGGGTSYIRLDDGTTSGYLVKNPSSSTTNNALAGALYTYTDGGKAFQHIHEGSPLFTILSGGNVGIGTTSPAAKLDVSGSVLIDLFKYSQTGNGIYFRRGFVSADTYNMSILAYDHSSGGASADGLSINAYDGVSFCAGSNTRAEKMRLDYTGNVGIGTTTINAKLQVYAGTATENIPTIWIGDNTNILKYIPYTGGGGYNNASVAGGSALFNTINSTWWIGTHNGAALRFGSDKAISFYNGGASINMYISGSGNVGIGTTSPTAYLHITNGTTSVAPLGFTSTSAALLTNVTANKMEYDGNSFYLTSAQTVRGAIERLIYSSTSAVTVTSGTDQNLIGTAGQTWMATIMPANFMVKGRTLRIYAQGTYQGTASDTLSFKFTYGSTFTLYAPNSANAITVSTTNTKQWELTFNLVCTDTTTSTACLFGSRAANAQYGQIMLGDASTTAATTVSAMGLRHNATINTNDTFDNTVTNTIGFSCTITAAGSAAATTVVCNRFIIQVLN